MTGTSIRPMTSKQTFTVRHQPELARVAQLIQRWEVPESGLMVTIGPVTRSNAQNAYLWGVAYKVLAEHLTEKYGRLVKTWEVHETCKDHMLPKTEVPWRDRPLSGSTRNLSRDEFSDYLMQVQELGAKMGVFIPDPESVDSPGGAIK